MDKREKLMRVFGNFFHDHYIPENMAVEVDKIIDAILHEGNYALNLVAEKPVGGNTVQIIPVIDKNVVRSQSSGDDKRFIADGAGNASSTNPPDSQPGNNKCGEGQSSIGEAPSGITTPVSDSQPLTDTLLVFDEYCYSDGSANKCPSLNDSHPAFICTKYDTHLEGRADQCKKDYPNGLALVARK